MRFYPVIGVILIALGILALSIRSITYFTTDQVTGPFGFLTWNVSEPHTIFFGPVAGIIALVVGIGLVLTSRRRLDQIN